MSARTQDAMAAAIRSRVRRVAMPARPDSEPARPDSDAARPPATLRAGIEVIGICVSTGGPRVLRAVLESLPVDFPIPALVVQHMTAGFVEGCAGSLDRQVSLPVAMAQDGAMLQAGVWFAPDHAHLILGQDRRLCLDHRPRVSGHRPSGDMLLSSLARAMGPYAAAVVLTGMGVDGVAGLAEVLAARGETIAQDEPSSAVYGMPRAAAERGAALRLAPAAIGRRLARIGR